MVIATELSSERLPLEQLPALGGVAVASWVIAGAWCVVSAWIGPRPAVRISSVVLSRPVLRLVAVSVPERNGRM
jgi:hypothetical protein